MRLPAIGVDIPSDDWIVLHVHEYPKEEADTFTRLTAEILHRPSGLHLVVATIDTANQYSWKVTHPDRGATADDATTKEVIDAWNALAVECMPVLRAEASRYGFVGLWDGEEHEIPSPGDGLFEIFVSEHVVAKSYNRTEDIVLRHDAEDKYFFRKRDDLDSLKNRNEYSYWSKKVQNWVSLSS